jgi:hypothetical protein
MPSDNPWSKQWTILDSDGSGKTLTPEGSQFKLEAQPGVGEVLCYRLRAGKLIDKRFDGRPFYPVGVRDLTVGSLPKWNAQQPNVRNAYLNAAHMVKDAGRRDPLAARLEATFRLNGTSAVARIYYLKGVRQDGRDWIVFDIVTPGGSQARTLSAAATADDAGGGDGTGHGDG